VATTPTSRKRKSASAARKSRAPEHAPEPHEIQAKIVRLTPRRLLERVSRAHGGNDCVRIGDHERAHVYQYLALGPFFLPLYFMCGGISARNRFEQAADRYAQTGKGWWPWA